MNYRLIIHPKAEKDIDKLHTQTAERVIKKILALKTNPRPPGYKKMIGYESDRALGQECYRIRIGDIRAIYTIEEQIITITVVQVEKRGDIY